MTKAIAYLILFISLTTPSALASRSRLESLGDSKNGSVFINDDRNVFLNPAEINNYKDKLYLDLGSSFNSSDSSAFSKPQGGFTKQVDSFVYGIYVGKESDRTVNQIQNLNSNTVLGQGTFLFPAHALDLVMGGETLLGSEQAKWGVGAYYSSSSFKDVAVDKSSSAYGIRLGVDYREFAVFSKIELASNLTDTRPYPDYSNSLTGKLAVDVGATYKEKDATYFAKYTTLNSSLTSGTLSPIGSGVLDFNTTAYTLGVGWENSRNKIVTFFTRLQFEYQKDSTKRNGVESQAVYYNVPLILSAETAVSKMLTVRGAISHSLYGKTKTAANQNSFTNETAVAVGLGLNLGELTVDALIGNSLAVSSGGSEMGVYSQAGDRFGFGDNMCTRISLVYGF